MARVRHSVVSERSFLTDILQPNEDFCNREVSYPAVGGNPQGNVNYIECSASVNPLNQPNKSINTRCPAGEELHADLMDSLGSGHWLTHPYWDHLDNCAQCQHYMHPSLGEPGTQAFPNVAFDGTVVMLDAEQEKVVHEAKERFLTISEMAKVVNLVDWAERLDR